MAEISLPGLLKKDSWKPLALFRSRYLWIVAGMLVLSTLLYYLTPQERSLPLISFPLTRHTVERIIFLLPVAGAAFAFGWPEGVAVLGLSALIMLPRVIFMSPHPLDALFETLGIVAVGGVFVWMIDAQERERKLRQKTVEKLETLNTMSATLCQTADLDETLNRALDQVLEAVSNLEPKGAILLLDRMSQHLRLKAHRGLALDLVGSEIEIALGECLCGAAAESRDVLIVPDALKDPRHTRCPELSPHSHVCIPLQSKEELVGVIDLYINDAHPVDLVDRQLFASIGRQIGVAVENARLCENLRFYIRQITHAQEDERKRIARELHDETAQGLIELSRRLDDLVTLKDGLAEPATARLDMLQQRIEDLLQGVRRFSRDLRPSVLDDLGLLPALEGLVADVEHFGIEPVLQTQGTPRRLPPDVELALFRIVQEALNNVKKHSGANRVTIEVEFFPRRVRVSIHDNGCGLELRGRLSDLVAMGKFGLVGMEERIQLLGGNFTVLHSTGTGTIVVADIPA
jgi:two-component system sensor histidine kinase DegS